MVLLAVVAVNSQVLQAETAGNENEEVIATFNSTRIITGHSIERMREGQLDFRISHRFGRLNTGGYNFWGLDQANIHIGFDYGITDRVMIGIGRGTYEKTYDGLVKLSILRQKTGKNSLPLSLSFLSTAAYNTLKWEQPGELPIADRFSYTQQILIGRKFNDWLSFEVNPTYVHRNLVDTEQDLNDTWSIGAGGRLKITERTSLNVEYYYVVPPQPDLRSTKTYNPLSIGLDIVTGGHVFQLHATNSLAMIEKGFITETTGSWLKGDIHFGFNISRVFALK